MCMKYYMEFWHPFTDRLSAERERRLRGQGHTGYNTPAPGQGYRVTYWVDCRDRRTTMSRPRCIPSKVTSGGYTDNRIHPFCVRDQECQARLSAFREEFLRIYNVTKSAGFFQSTSKREQQLITERLRKIWQEWVSAYENHRRCPDRRHSNRTFAALVSSGVLPGSSHGMSDATRLRESPHRYDEPIVGFERYGR